MHRYQGGDGDRRAMLAAVGAACVDDLFAGIPAGVRVGELPLPLSQSEDEVRRELWSLALRNTTPECMASFLGAGVYRHTAPAVADAMLQRGEFFTAYTPYQPEVGQGTLQAIFEFQTYVCQLTEQDVANASLYDGATAVVEAILLAHRSTGGRRRAVVSGALHPEFRAVLDTYCQAQEIELTTVGWDAAGQVDREALSAALGGDVCAVVVQSPNFFGVVERLGPIAEAARGCGALSVHAVAEATSLGLLAPGGRFSFDVVCGEMQAFGVPASFGGPHVGFFAVKQQHLRQMPGRLVGETVDRDGARAFVLTLSTREQHIRRAKATSNICTNHGLIALYVTVVLSLLGKHGVRDLALATHATAEFVKRGIAEQGTLRLAFPGSPTYNEFLVLHDEPDSLLERLQAEGILAGVATTRFGGRLPRGILIAATEQNTREECARLLAALGRLS